MLCNSDHSGSSTFMYRWDEGKGCTVEQNNVTGDELRRKNCKN